MWEICILLPLKVSLTKSAEHIAPSLLQIKEKICPTESECIQLTLMRFVRCCLHKICTFMTFRLLWWFNLSIDIRTSIIWVFFLTINVYVVRCFDLCWNNLTLCWADVCVCGFSANLIEQAPSDGLIERIRCSFALSVSMPPPAGSIILYCLLVWEICLHLLIAKKIINECTCVYAMKKHRLWFWNFPWLNYQMP